jgi:hypothetical protein
MHLNIKFLGIENGDMINMDFAIASFYTQSHNRYIVHICDILHHRSSNLKHEIPKHQKKK